MIHDDWQQYLQTAPGGAAAAGVADVGFLAAVRFQGSNARDFLQGYLTCDTTELTDGALTPTALCSLKGRVVMNGWCAPAGEHDVLLVLHESLVDPVAAFLEPYLRFSRHTDMTDLRSNCLVLASLDLPDSAGGLALDDRRRLFPISDLGGARTLWEAHPHVSAEAWLAALTADGVPLVSGPVSDTFLPQMLALDTLGAVDFEKGCYLGQEVVARAQHRGQVKRRLARLAWKGAAAPPPGAQITGTDGSVQGQVVQSAAQAPSAGVLLAVLRQEAPEVLRQGDIHLSRLA